MSNSIVNNNTNKLNNLEQSAKQEWLQSGIDKEIFDLNVKVLIDDEPYDYLLYGQNTPRRNDGRIRDFLYRKYRHIEQGGWYVAGIDPLNNYQSMLWGAFKPNRPRRDPEKQHKFIKYEHPYKTATRAFFLRISDQRWQFIADKFGVPILPEDKLLGFWHWVWLHNLPLTLCEGAKKAAALLTLGYPAVGLPGVNAGYRNPKDQLGNYTNNVQLIEDLQLFAGGGRQFCLCFDKDTNSKTVLRVERAIAQTARLLSLSGSAVTVAIWQEAAKGIDDLISQVGGDAAIAALENAIAFDRWKTNQYCKLTYASSIVLNQRYLGELLIPEIEKLIVLKAPKGSGKTQSLAPIVAEAIRNGQPVILLSHRVQLAQAIAGRVGIPYVSEIHTAEYGSLLGFALCVDSLHPFGQARFNAENWKEPLVIIDECEQVIWHTLTASTEVKKQRLEVFKQFSGLLKNAFAPGAGKVIIADADMSDLSIELVLGLGVAENITPYIVNNLWKGSPYNLYHYEETTPIVWAQALEKHIREGGKPFISVDGQKASSQWGTKVLEAYLKSLFPHLRILRIDSESIADPEHEAYGCIESLNQILPSYDLVLASPSIGTGVSIDIVGHFSSVWGCFQGVGGENATRQALSRIRENIDRHLWVAKCGLGFVGNGALNINSLLKSENLQFKANLNLLQLAGLSFDEDINVNKTALNVWAKMAVRINAGLSKYRDTVLQNLREEGHTILSPTSLEASKETKALLKATKESTYEQECQQSVNEDISKITETEYTNLKQKKAKTRQERHQQRKYELEKRYGIEATTDLIRKDDKGYYSKLRMAYYLGVGNEFLSARDSKAGEKILEEKSAWLPDFNKGQLGLKIAALQKFNIPELIQAEELKGTDIRIEQLASDALSVRWQVRSLLGITLSENDPPMTIFRQLISKIGLSLKMIRREGTGSRERVYQVIGFEDGRKQIFAKWLESERPLTASIKKEAALSTTTQPSLDRTA